MKIRTLAAIAAIALTTGVGLSACENGDKDDKMMQDSTSMSQDSKMTDDKMGDEKMSDDKMSDDKMTDK